MKSIMQTDDSYCYLCRKLHDDDFPKVTEEHHVVFGNGRRSASEKWGLKIRLCKYHHTEGKEAVHRNREIADMVKQDAQREFEKRFPEESFLQIFGRNYL